MMAGTNAVIAGLDPAIHPSGKSLYEGRTF
jgi:hypothetical protein